MISYIGGKSRIGTWIREYIPKDIETYVEPFSGMYWVFFKMDISSYPNLKQVVYNDFNSLNVNLDWSLIRVPELVCKDCVSLGKGRGITGAASLTSIVFK